MAKILGVPQKIIRKAPSAGLWEGQTDEGEMGIKYEDLDKMLKNIIYGEIEPGKNYHTLQKWISLHDKVRKTIESTEHKRKVPESLLRMDLYVSDS